MIYNNDARHTHKKIRISYPTQHNRDWLANAIGYLLLLAGNFRDSMQYRIADSKDQQACTGRMYTVVKHR